MRTTHAHAVTITGHQCPRTHRTPRALARCAFPHLAYITGEGAHAVIVTCGTGHMRLHPTTTDARADLAQLTARGCCTRCTGEHTLARLDLDHQEGTQP